MVRAESWTTLTAQARPYTSRYPLTPVKGAPTEERKGTQHPDLFDMEVIVRRQDQEHCASITCMIRHYVARRAKVIEDHPHNAAMRAPV